MDIDLHGISQAAFDLIVSEEDSDQAYYVRHYEHFEWPQGASGPTVAIGYDCGYVTVAELRADWTGIVDDSVIAALVPAVGLRGEAAASFVRAHGGSVSIPWDVALAEFANREIPKWLMRVETELPNFNMLAPDCRGSLLSLAYNRGASFTLPGPRYAEMRAIRQHMVDLAFDKIPAEFLSMRRLWPVGGDLWRRRVHEADLFQHGLLAAPAPTPMVA
jgi:hypothetical protein